MVTAHEKPSAVTTTTMMMREEPQSLDYTVDNERQLKSKARLYWIAKTCIGPESD